MSVLNYWADTFYLVSLVGPLPQNLLYTVTLLHSRILTSVVDINTFKWTISGGSSIHRINLEHPALWAINQSEFSKLLNLTAFFFER